MKPNLRQKSKTKKVITKLWIAITILIIAIISLFLFSEKVHKIGIKSETNKFLYVYPLDGYTAHDIFYYNDSPDCYLYLNELPKPDSILDSYDNSMQNISLMVGENSQIQRLNTRAFLCSMGHRIIEDYPIWISVNTNEEYFYISNPEIIRDIRWSLEGYILEYLDDEEYEGLPSLQMSFIGNKPGKAIVNITHFDRYNFSTNGGYCRVCSSYYSPHTCRGWMKVKEQLNISVEARYNLKYEANGDNVENLCENTTRNIPELNSRINLTKLLPTRKGYTFLGWDENPNAVIPKYKAGEDNSIVLTWKEGLGSIDKPVTQVLYAIWEKEYLTPYTLEYYYNNINDNSRTEGLEYEPTNRELKQKIETNLKENYTFQKLDNCVTKYNVIKIYYVSGDGTGSENPEPTDPETGKRLYTITIDNNKSGHTYNSYQVFQGDYYEKEEKKLDENNVEKIVKIPMLTNIEWGPELQKEIITENEENKGKTHGDKIIENLKAQNELYKDCITAEDVAKKLQGKENDGDIIREFTNIVGKYLLDNNITLTKGTNTLIEQKDINGNIISSNYKIDKLNPGYYIVIDAETKEKDDAYSRYLIDVVKDVTMEVKSSTPNLSKKVLTGNIESKEVKEILNEETGNFETKEEYVKDEKRNTATYKEKSENYNAEDYNIKFELQSYIPETDSYSNYKFKVVDILAKGFDLDTSSIKVMLGENEYPKTREKVIKGNPETGEADRTETVVNYTITPIVINADNYETYKSYFEEEGQTYTEEYTQSNYGKTIILLELQDLVGQMSDNFVEKGQDIFVRYNAKLNGTGEVGNTPNINEAYLQYSNNPYNANETTQTTTQITYTYTIDLNLSKIAEIKKSNNTNNNTINENTTNNENTVETQTTESGVTTPDEGNQGTTENTENAETTENTKQELKYLAGAEFEIYSGPEYIKEEGSLIPSKNPNRKLIATIKTDEILDSEGNIINEAGHAMYNSLAAGTYYIKETKAPEGYNKLREEIQLEIKATCDELGTITWKIEPVTNKLVLAEIEVKEITGEKIDEVTGEITQEVVRRIPEVKLQVENTSGFQLPATGGIGTIIFTVAGLSLMVIAVVSLKSNKKKIK